MVGSVDPFTGSRLARNDRDWSQLVELGAITKTVLIDHPPLGLRALGQLPVEWHGAL